MHGITPEMERCIQNCQDCHNICLNMATNHCLKIGGAHVEQNHFRLMMDCAQICQASADFMLRNSPHHTKTCAACVDVCTDCANSCENVGDMEKCVVACRKCAESCRQMAA